MKCPFCQHDDIQVLDTRLHLPSSMAKGLSPPDAPAKANLAAVAQALIFAPPNPKALAKNDLFSRCALAVITEPAVRLAVER